MIKKTDESFARTAGHDSDMNITPVILCGGSGTRLWPTSRKAYPKQFAPLIGSRSLYQMTLARVASAPFEPALIMTGNDFRFMATDQANQLGLSDARVVIEPCGRDTAPAILTAALILAEDPTAQMLVLPSDHLVADIDAFHQAIQIGADKASGGRLLTFGVKPTRPETGFGYLELEHPPDGPDPVPLTSFREKPDHETAQMMLESDRFLWNAGIFLAKASDMVRAFEIHAPDLLEPCRTALETGAADLDFFRLGSDGYQGARGVSFDYAVMEKAQDVAAIPMSAGWSDLGTWDAIWTAAQSNDAGVATAGNATAVDCTDSYLRSDDETMRLVGLGLDGIIAVAMNDAVLVADRDRTQDVKLVVETLRSLEIPQADTYPRAHRPWGWYETLCLGNRFQVKRIMVNPGGILSLQSHHHRSEHWIVVQGTAEVTIGADTKLVTENESVYIPLGAQHRMANPGKLPMYLIEVQTGAYLAEDDVVRYEDAYNRD
ncbi:MAG: mannose-1-phosphate guanylyltransferase/mannose-6-phosphate isomerase [Pseudomonadota bacterium]